MNLQMSSSTNQKVIVGLSLVFIVLGISFTVYNWPECSETMVIPMDGFVHNIPGNMGYWGMNTDKDHLAFGGTSLGNTLKRSMMVQHKQKAMVDIRLSGNIAPFVRAEPAQFEIEDGVEQDVAFYFSPEFGMPDGEYTGNVVYCFKDE